MQQKNLIYEESNLFEMKGMAMMILLLLLVLLVGAEMIWLQIQRTFSDSKHETPPDTEIRS